MPRLLCIVAGGQFLLIGGCQPKSHVDAATRDLLRTDRAWAKLATANGPVDSVVAYWTSDARVVLAGQPVLVGSDAIRQMVAGTRAIPGFHISWTPDSAVVLRVEILGIRRKQTELRLLIPPAPFAQPRVGISQFARRPGGSWRCSVDISNEGPRGASAELR